MKVSLYERVAYSPEGEGGGAPSGGGDSSGSTPSAPSGGSTPASSSSPSGDTSTPSSSKPEPTPSEPLSDDAFSGFGADTDDEDDAIQTTPSDAPKEPTELPPKEPPKAPAPPAAPKQEEQKAPPAASQPGPQEATPPQLPSPSEPAKMAQALLGSIDDFAKHLAATPEFVLSEEELEAINTDVTTAIPQLLAKSYIRAQASALNQMERVIPAMVEKYMKVSKARDESQGKFYDRWKEAGIDRSKHSQIVDRLAQTYRKENPSATLEQMVEELGPVVMMVAKVAPPIPGAAPQRNGAAGTPQLRRAPSPPFQPAVGGPASPPASAVPDEWGGFGAESEE